MSRIVALAERLTVAKDLGPERDYTEKGRIRKVFSTMSEHKLGMLAVNLVTALFAAPLIVMFFVLMTMYEDLSIAEAGFNFSGFIGIGYGLTDDTVAGINMIYGIRQDFFLYFFTPSMMILSIGVAGAYHCIRNWLWGVEVKPKHWFRGVKLHWWKFLSAFTFMGLVGTNAAYSTIELMRLMSTVGSAHAGIWIWCITALLLAVLTILFVSMWLPLSVMFKVGYGDSIKNAVLCILITGIVNVVVAVVLIAPLFLSMVNIINYIIYVAMLFYGGSFYITCNLSFGMFAGDMTLNTLYEYEQKQSMQQKKSGKDKRRAKTDKNKDRVAADAAPAPTAAPEAEISVPNAPAEDNGRDRNKPVNRQNNGAKRKPKYRRK